VIATVFQSKVAKPGKHTREPTAVFALMLVIGAVFPVPRVSAQGPTKITQCQAITEPGSYVLVNPIGPPPPGMPVCLNIMAHDVTIDLAGFTIIGAGHGVGIAIDGRGSVVRNGIVANFGNGIEITADITMVEGVRAVGNAEDGIVTVEEVIAYVKDNIALENHFSGFRVSMGVLSGNNAINNKAAGILAGGGLMGGGSVTNNLAVSNGIGIEVRCPFNIIGNMGIENRNSFGQPTPGISVGLSVGRPDCTYSGNLSP
jgi:hypothetical protein